MLEIQFDLMLATETGGDQSCLISSYMNGQKSPVSP